MARHGAARARPAELVPGTVRVITARLNYWPRARAMRGRGARRSAPRIRRALRARTRLPQGAARTACSAWPSASSGEVGPFGYRVFTDSAPVLEVALAAKSGLGWRGKHTLLLTRDMGSYFFLGEIYTDLPLPVTPPVTAHCGTCTRVHRRLSHRRDRRAVRARCAPLHLVSDDRAQGQHSRGAAAADRQPRLRLRRLPARLSLEPLRSRDDRPRISPKCATASTARRLVDAVRMDASRVPATHARAARSGGSATSDGCATSPWRSASAASEPSIIAALQARADDPSPLVREHVAWALARHRDRADAPSGSQGPRSGIASA